MHRLTSLLSAVFILGACCSTETGKTVVASYVTSWTEVMPDPFLLTHINFIEKLIYIVGKIYNIVMFIIIK